MKFILPLFLLLIACKISFAQTELPADYPSDLPKHTFAKYNGSEKLDDGIVYMFDADQSVKDIYDFFVAEMPKAGYKVFSDPMLIDSGGSGLWEKADKIVTLLVMKPEGFEQTSISISITSK